MRIGIDARFFGPSIGTGIGRYSQRLIEELERIDTVNEYRIFLRDENFDLYRPASPRFTKVRAPWRWYSRDEQLRLPGAVRRAQVDFMHYLHFNVPLLSPQPYVVTIHDLILSTYPTPRASTLGPAKYWLKQFAYRVVISSAVRRSRRVITVTNHTKQDIVRHYGYPVDRIAVTYEGFDPSPMRATSVDLSPYGITGRYLVCVGNAYPHKNLERLIDAMSIINRSGSPVSLVLVGREDFFSRRLHGYVREKHADGYVKFTGYVDDDALDALYRGAVAHVFPSLYEGFGLPGLEAMMRGIPVVAARASCFPEVFGDAARFFDPLRIDDMATTIRNVIDDRSLRTQLIDRGRERIRRFSWRSMAEQTLAVYNTVRTQTRR